MKPVFLVTPDEADIARRMEKKLLELPVSSGVLFAGVSVEPARPGSSTTFRVWIGCHRSFDEGLMDPLVRFVLREEIENGARVSVEAHRGLGRGFLESR